jgi:hypothetical protein
MIESADAESCVVSLRRSSLSASSPVSLYMSQDLALFFERIAEQWRGWNGEIEWSSPERDLRLAACTDPTGHVTLRYLLQQPFTGFHWEPEGT